MKNPIAIDEAVFLLVVGRRGELRSKSLAHLVRVLPSAALIDPVKIPSDERLPEIVDEVASEVLLGRRLSNGELGCALAHRNAIRLAHSRMTTNREICWTLIAEDDADISEAVYREMAEELLTSSLNGPSLVTYYHGNEDSGGHKCSGGSIKRSRRWFTGTVCYAVNRLAVMELTPFLALPVNYVADWPVFFLKVKAFHSTRIHIGEAVSESGIGTRPVLPITKRIRMHFRQISYAPRLSRQMRVPMFGIVKCLVIDPVMRDVQNRLRRWRENPKLD